MTTATATQARPTTGALGEQLLTLMRALDSAEDQTLARWDGAYGDAQEALIKLLGTQRWPRGMAMEAINYAMTQGVTLREAMYANQTG
ncbi:hypothetical protein [Streptosporangium lutulentum]|uniref:Uncharacterized protein n=1 Tax=Streptosporangium lutulentum TaxID=1461250 RepID=A0ABT9QBQ9_9ACTN|nr:hypothetical protein [Streptosporangium lutulentum]MDP9843354.1 hypothetical protein [Streptosporangium lutulentum]